MKGREEGASEGALLNEQVAHGVDSNPYVLPFLDNTSQLVGELEDEFVDSIPLGLDRVGDLGEVELGGEGLCVERRSLESNSHPS